MDSRTRTHIKNLLDLSKSDNKHEASSALATAKELMEAEGVEENGKGGFRKAAKPKPKPKPKPAVAKHAPEPIKNHSGLPHVSASQVKTFQRCNRKWYFEKIMGKRGPSTHAQRRGTAIHEALEIYIKTGEIVDEVHTNVITGRVIPSPTGPANEEETSETFLVRRFVEATKEHIDHEKVVAVEGNMRLETYEGGPDWIGFIDLLTTKRVIDYKTTSNFRWAKTPEELKNDAQACSYVLSIFRQFPEADEFDVKLIYIQTSNKIKVNVKPVEATFTRAECEAVFAEAVAEVKKMSIAAKYTDPNKVPGNLAACMDFGGCEHRTYCDRVVESMLNKKPVKKPNRFTHPELFGKRAKVVTLRPPETEESAEKNK